MNDTPLGHPPDASPPLVTSQVLSAKEVNGVTMAVHIENGTAGGWSSGIWDSSTGTLSVGSWQSTHAIDVESLLMRWQPALIVELSNSSQKDRADGKVQSSLERLLGESWEGDAMVDGADLKPMDARAKQQIASMFVNRELYVANALMLEDDGLSGCVSALIRAEELGGHDNFAHFQRLELDVFLTVDRAATEALQILPRCHSEMASHSLLGSWKKHCLTSVGRRRLRGFLLSPLRDLVVIERRLDFIELMRASPALERVIRTSVLRGCQDPDRLTRMMLENKTLTIDDVQHAGQLMSRLLALDSIMRQTLGVDEEGAETGCCIAEDALGERGKVLKPGIRELFFVQIEEEREAILRFFSFMESAFEVDRSLAVDKRKEEKSRGHIYESDQPLRLRSCLAPELFKARQLLESKTETIEKYREKISRYLGKQLPTKSQRGELARIQQDDKLGFVIRCPKSMVEHVHGCSSIELGYSRLNKSEFLFTTSEFESMGRDVMKAREEYGRTEAQVMRQVSTVTATYQSLVEKAGDVISLLDILTASVRVYAEPGRGTFCRPVFHDGELEIKEGRHLLLEGILGSEVISNDLSMSLLKRRLVVLTGPNMGGKSTFIRQIALISFVAQLGLFVPADMARLPVLKRIFCRVGASDSIFRGVSTFMSEMLEAAVIIREAGNNSLVIVDELGRGTSTADGFGLSYAFAHHLLRETRCFCIFATHFTEMEELAASDMADHVKEMHMAIHDENQVTDLKFLYKVAEGRSVHSFGINVAREAGFPSEVLDTAKELLKGLENQQIINHSF